MMRTATFAMLLAVWPVAAAPPPALEGDLEGLGALADSVIREAMEREHLPGVAFVLVQGGEVALSRAYGHANLERRTPVSPETTLFRIGSISKALTALAVLQLADRGKLDLDADVNRYLGRRKLPERYGEPVRVRHLLTHTGGFDQTGLGRHARSPESRPSLAEFVAKEVVRIRPPGVIATYDTYGITLAGYLVERVSGRPYAEFMRREIFEPLGMDRTWVEAPPRARRDLAVGYGHTGEGYVPQGYELYVTTPASSIDATPMDMGRLLIALLGDGSNGSGRILSAEAVRDLPERSFREHAEFAGFASGFWEDLRHGSRGLHHGGTMMGFTTELYLMPEHGLGFFLATNRDGEAGGGPVRLRETLTRRLMERWFPRGGTPEERAPAGAAAVDTTALAGAWASTLYCHTCAPGKGWTLFYSPIESAGPGAVEYDGRRWIAEGPRVFRSEGGDDRIAFVPDGQGRLRYLVHERFRLVRERMDEALLDEVLAPGWRKRPATSLAAQVYRAAGDWEKAAAAFESLAGSGPEPGRSLFRAGSAWLRAGRPERALEALQRAWDTGTWQPESAYGMAVAHAMRDDADQAFRWLERALDAGLEEPEMLQDDPRLEPLRSDPRFAKLVARAADS